MLAQINMEIEGQDLNYNMGSLFHGYLMSKIDTAYAEYFHHNSTHPYTSCIFKENKTNKYFWRITTYNKKAYYMIIKSFLQEMPKELYLRHKNINIKIKSSTIEETSFEKLFLSTKQYRKIRLVTPTTFKSKENTHIFPNISILLNGVISKINEHSDTIKLKDKEILEELISRIYIRNYNLKTSIFSLEGIKIKGFTGLIEISAGKDKTLEQLLNFLILSSEYTGFGIKTTLGMGGIKIE